jgi:hypothetical protein
VGKKAHLEKHETCGTREIRYVPILYIEFTLDVRQADTEANLGQGESNGSRPP